MLFSSSPGTLTVDGKKVAESRIEQTSPVGKFTLDESFDVGEDTGTPVIDEYDAKMPFKFTGTLEKVQIKLGPNELTPQQRGELEQLKREISPWRFSDRTRDGRCPLLAQSRHAQCADECPLLGVKRT